MVTSWINLGYTDIDAFIESTGQYNDIGYVGKKLINDIEYVYFTIINQNSDSHGEVFIYEGNDLAYIITIAYNPEIDLGDYQEIISNILN